MSDLQLDPAAVLAQFDRLHAEGELFYAPTEGIRHKEQGIQVRPSRARERRPTDRAAHAQTDGVPHLPQLQEQAAGVE